MPRTRLLLAALAAAGAISLTCAPALDSAHGSPLGLRFGATSGPRYAPGPNAADVGLGLGVQLEASRRAGPRLEWFGEFAYADFGEFAMPSFELWGLYVPPAIEAEAFRTYGFELGLRRHIAARGLDLFVEGAAGVTRTEQPEAGERFANDRRPDPLADANRHRVSGAGASFSLGAGGVIARNGRFGLVTAVSARWLAGLGVSGPIVPVRLGLVWPLEPAAATAGATAATSHEVGAGAPGKPGPRLRLGAGTAWMDAPDAIWNSSIPAAGFAAGVEWPLARGLALRLDGSQALFVSSKRAVLWQGVDGFGNLVNHYSDAAPHWTVTFVTLGMSAGRAIGRWTPYLHAGVGLARTGGDGSTIRTVAFVPPSGPSLEPLYLTGHQGFGRPHTGAAWSAGAGLELALAPATGAFLEAAMQGVNLDAPDVQVLGLRAGVVLR